MIGTVLLVGIILIIINTYWICLEYEYGYYDFPIVTCIIDIVIGIIGLILCLCTEDTWKVIGIMGMVNLGIFVVSNIIYYVLDEMYCIFIDTCSSIYAIIALICIVVFVVINICTNSSNSTEVENIPTSNIVAVETPTIDVKYYELLSASDINLENTNEPDMLMYMPSKEGNYYQFYYADKNEEGEVIAKPYKVMEADVELIIQSNGVEDATSDYLLETTTTYYEEDRSKRPAEKIVVSSETEYKLYLRDITFKNMIVVGNSK